MKKKKKKKSVFDEANIPKESRVSKKLSEITTKQVIIMVLTLILLMPLFASDYWNSPPTG